MKLALVAVLVAGCSPPADLPPVSPRPAAGELAGTRIVVEARSPGADPDPALREAFVKAFSGAGIVVVGPAEGGAALVVEVAQPLGEWGGAYSCRVTTYADAAKKETVSDGGIDRKCASPNAADTIVQRWLAAPKIRAALAKAR